MLYTAGPLGHRESGGRNRLRKNRTRITAHIIKAFLPSFTSGWTLFIVVMFVTCMRVALSFKGRTSTFRQSFSLPSQSSLSSLRPTHKHVYISSSVALHKKSLMPLYRQRKLYMSTLDKDSPVVIEAVNKITAKGDEIKAIKALQAPTMKEDIAPLVQELLALKAAYKELTGEDFGPPPKATKPKSSKEKLQPSTASTQSKKKKKRDDGDEKTMGIEEIRKVRVDKMSEIKEQGLNPFKYNYERSHKTAELHELFKDLEDSAEDENADVAVAGEIRATFFSILFSSFPNTLTLLYRPHNGATSIRQARILQFTR